MKYTIEIHVRESRMEFTIMQGEDFSDMTGFSVPIHAGQAHAIAEMFLRAREHYNHTAVVKGSYHEEFRLG